MKFPFTTEQFLNVFTLYNLSVWPFQIIFHLLAFASLFLIFNRKAYTDKTVGFILSFFWIWMGVVYHGIFFSAINRAAYLFGLLFVLQGVLIFYNTLSNKNQVFRFQPDLSGISAVAIIGYGLLVYPVISSFSGHGYPNGPTFEI